ncbi:hypothetical protein FHS27_006468 [Rhodopirellula rubra]|uniref:Uncharacterized protein n=1 Tax=Aporhodopirellula rubra TaxID=980271 RepID=A0A7W5E5K5_9BACT|nr:hypothetical protein [Aporhodopirellula rubra]
MRASCPVCGGILPPMANWRFKRRSLRSSVSPMQIGTSTEVPTAWLHFSLR